MTSEMNENECNTLERSDMCPDRSMSDFYCTLCDAHMHSEQMWESHISGKRHLKNLQREPGQMPSKVHAIKVDAPATLIEVVKTCHEPLVGLNYMTELQRSDPALNPFYTCHLCQANCTLSMVIKHILGTKHRLTFLKVVDPKQYDNIECMDLTRTALDQLVEEIAHEYEKQQGCGTPTVKLEKPKAAPPPVKREDDHSSVRYNNHSVSLKSRHEMCPEAIYEKHRRSGLPPKYVIRTPSRSPPRPKKHYGSRSPPKYVIRTPSRSPPRHKKHCGSRSPPKYVIRTPSRSPQRYKKHGSRASPKYVIRTPSRSPPRYKKHYGSRASPKYVIRIPSRSPPRNKKHSGSRSFLKYRRHSGSCSPLKYMRYYQTRSPSKSRSPKYVRMPSRSRSPPKYARRPSRSRSPPKCTRRPSRSRSPPKYARMPSRAISAPSVKRKSRRDLYSSDGMPPPHYDRSSHLRESLWKNPDNIELTKKHVHNFVMNEVKVKDFKDIMYDLGQIML